MGDIFGIGIILLLLAIACELESLRRLIEKIWGKEK